MFLKTKSWQLKKYIQSNLSTTAILRGSFENEALENEDRSTKHPKLENEAPKTRKRSTQKTRHWSVLYKHETNVNTAEIKRDNEYSITNRTQFKSTQVVNAFPPLRGRPGGRLCFRRDQKTENAQTISRMLLYCQ